MPDLLAIHTATDVCSIALSLDGDIRERDETKPRAHAERLVPLIEELTCGQNADSLHTLEGIVVAAGPGSYTGLRIGLSTAKGLAWAKNLDLYAVSTLQGFAQEALKERPSTPVLVIMPARRGEIYAGVYDPGGRALTDDTALAIQDLRDWATKYVTSHVTFTGPDPTVCDDLPPMPLVLADRDSGAEPYRHAFVRTSATATSLIACVQKSPATYRVHDLSRFEPFYLKSFVARKPAGSVFDRLSF